MGFRLLLLFFVIAACGDDASGMPSTDASLPDSESSGDSEPGTDSGGENESPTITLRGDETLSIERGTGDFVDPGAVATDAEDGDISANIEVRGDVDTQVAGTYVLTYTVTDSGGATASAMRTVVVFSPGSPSDEVVADIRSATRTNGVSPETVYFNADASTCSDCVDLFGLDTAIADAYSVLAYHFDFDDSDSGVFETTGDSRNRQISGSPRAAHTFHCFGEGDPNWDPSDQRCEFNVGVRVQALDGDFGDAFIQINIQPLVGPGGYYRDSDVTCVSATSDFADCLALAPDAATATDVPSVGSWHGKVAIIDNDGGSYSDICMGADEQHGTAIAYGPNVVQGAPYGARPGVGRLVLSSRPGECVHTYRENAEISMLSDNMPERNEEGELIDGFGFGQKAVGLRVGRTQNGATLNFVQVHDIESIGSPGGGNSYFSMSGGDAGCRANPDLDCELLPLPSFLFLTDSVFQGHPDNLPVAANIGCFNDCAAVDFVIMGNEANTSNEHNVRMMGAYGLVAANNWLRGNHIGGRGPKAQLTIRRGGPDRSLTNDPEDLTGITHIRHQNGSEDPENRYNMSVHNRINQMEHLPGHDGGAMHLIVGFFTIEDGTTYVEDANSASLVKSFNDGVYKTIRNVSYGADSTTDCGFRRNIVPDDTAYNQSNTFYYEGSVRCSGGGRVNVETEPLPVPGRPGS